MFSEQLVYYYQNISLKRVKGQPTGREEYTMDIRSKLRLRFLISDSIWLVCRVITLKFEMNFYVFLNYSRVLYVGEQFGMFKISSQILNIYICSLKTFTAATPSSLS